MSEYKPQFYPGMSLIAQNRRKYMDSSYQLKRLRSISDEDIVRLLGHRAPGEAYKTVHPPLEEMGEPDCPIRKIVEPTPGAKAGDRIRYIQFTDSVYFAPLHPVIRCWVYHNRWRGVDPGSLSGRTPLEGRERDIELISKDLLETELFDPARVGVRGASVHGHALRLDENGLMFDMQKRYIYDREKGEVVYVKDQTGRPLDKPIYVGKPLPEGELKKMTTIFRADYISMKDDPELLEFVQRIHWLRTLAGANPDLAKGI
ncbi:MAG: coenzyme-B sulfoethylthiotransferase subunit gamma [Candidatus Nezhaarchaeota archaeon]|nr:coenzyme-B sulfoethylthiotransferase subunit gamma [Candidatus Nezhaarchaeota archaeon]MCX8141671.1 coenzyme-B sulfoethylthiotransferase subunit gamma [Candidatus Nezhaarchaeota archaeon]MDW8049938.1 coenzyme-B sulfoethylthiotransferase subunit gamma [Nitrososphaerota archaeon]